MAVFIDEMGERQVMFLLGQVIQTMFYQRKSKHAFTIQNCTILSKLDPSLLENYVYLAKMSKTRKTWRI
jgi:hypothetical protein